MGGDGGTKAINRSYLRGAGTAGTTGDFARHKANEAAMVQDQEVSRAMHVCALSDQPLSGDAVVVVCPYGRLYNKEAAIEALLRRKQQAEGSSNDRRGGGLPSYIRGLKDLKEVRFLKDKTSDAFLCPVTGRELNGKTAAYVLVPGKPGAINAVSEYAINQMGQDHIFAEYEATDKIRLVPPTDLLVEIQSDLMVKREREAEARTAAKKKKKKKDKRKRENS